MTSKCTGLESSLAISRRQILQRFGMGVGSLALTDLMTRDNAATASDGVLQNLHHAPKAKRIIYLFQSGGPSHRLF